MHSSKLNMDIIEMHDPRIDCLVLTKQDDCIRNFDNNDHIYQKSSNGQQTALLHVPTVTTMIEVPGVEQTQT